MTEQAHERKVLPKLFPDLPKVINDTGISRLSRGAQKVYLAGGYHTLVNRIMKHVKSENDLDNRDEAFFRKRLARELIASSRNYHKDEESVLELLNYFDSKADKENNANLSISAQSISSDYFAKDGYIEVPKFGV